MATDLARAEALHGEGRGWPSAQQHAQFGEAVDVRGEYPQTGVVGAAPSVGRGRRTGRCASWLKRSASGRRRRTSIFVLHRLAPHSMRQFKVSTDPRLHRAVQSEGGETVQIDDQPRVTHRLPPKRFQMTRTSHRHWTHTKQSGNAPHQTLFFWDQFLVHSREEVFICRLRLKR